MLLPSSAAKRLGVSAGTLRNYAERGMIPVVTLPSGHRRFREEDVDALLARMCRRLQNGEYGLVNKKSRSNTGTGS